MDKTCGTCRCWLGPLSFDGDVVGWGDTLAEAIAQACLKARENGDG